LTVYALVLVSQQEDYCQAFLGGYFFQNQRLLRMIVADQEKGNGKVQTWKKAW
jgi:hypothetical protein